MPLITDSEMEDFDATILGAGFGVDDSNVVDAEDERTVTKLASCLASCFVSKRTKSSVAYRASTTPWRIST